MNNTTVVIIVAAIVVHMIRGMLFRATGNSPDAA